MAQRDFTGAYKNKPLTAKEITTKKSQLEKEKINLQKLKNLNLKGGIERANFLTRYNNSIAIIKNLEGGIRSGLSYSGALNINELQSKAQFIKQTSAGLYESKTHIKARY